MRDDETVCSQHKRWKITPRFDLCWVDIASEVLMASQVQNSLSSIKTRTLYLTFNKCESWNWSFYPCPRFSINRVSTASYTNLELWGFFCIEHKIPSKHFFSDHFHLKLATPVVIALFPIYRPFDFLSILSRSFWFWKPDCCTSETLSIIQWIMIWKPFREYKWLGINQS